MFQNFRELYKFRALVWALVCRHLTMRYRGSALGFLWSLLNPLFLMLVYLLVFRYYIRFQQVENYTIFLFCGLLPWIWCTSSLLEGTGSIVGSGHLITKSMFPAHLLPTVAVLTSLVNFLLSIPILVILMFFMGVPLKLTIIALPIVVLLQFLFLQGLTLALGAVNVHYRDVQHITANLLTFLFFLTPIIYPADVVPERLKFTLDLNPFALFTRFYHSLILDGALPPWTSLGLLVVVVGITSVVGNYVFNHYRESLAELL